jgi:ATP-dependent DNA helicase RecG
MANLKMIDTQGGGIKRMFTIQKNRFFPLPEFDLRVHDTVKVKIFGKILDHNYTAFLITNKDLDLETAIFLDYVQKKQINHLTVQQIKRLRDQGLIEGRSPNLIISSRIASITGEKARYIKDKAMDDDYYKNLILNYLENFGNTKKKDLEDLLFSKLSDVLSLRQKRDKISNILQSLKKKGLINVEGKLWKKVNK